MLETDVAGIYHTHADTETQKFTWIENLKEPADILSWILQDRGSNASGFQIFSIIDKANAAFLGLCGLRLRKDLNHEIDLTYRIHPSNRIKGIATECVTAIIHWGFTEKKLPRILAQVHNENEYSLRIIKKLHFERMDQTREWILFCLINPDNRS